MTCQYCTAKNDPEDHRCQRCGRRIHTAYERPGLDRTPVSTSALAPELFFESPAPARPAFGPQVVPSPASLPSSRERREHAYQASLFGPQEVSSRSLKEAPRKSSQTTPRPRPDKNAQQTLNFAGPVPRGNHALRTSVEARIYCNAPIAATPLRIMASVADCGLALIGAGMFAAPFRFMVQEPVWSNQMLFDCVATVIVISLFYRVLFCLANGDTPGIRMMGLHVIDFDGRKPTRRQRFQRLAGGCIGVVAGGLGLLWALSDEERLTWHDQISQTFPTPRQ